MRQYVMFVGGGQCCRTALADRSRLRLWKDGRKERDSSEEIDPDGQASGRPARSAIADYVALGLSTVLACVVSFVPCRFAVVCVCGICAPPSFSLSCPFVPQITLLYYNCQTDCFGVTPSRFPFVFNGRCIEDVLDRHPFSSLLHRSSAPLAPLWCRSPGISTLTVTLGRLHCI